MFPSLFPFIFISANRTNTYGQQKNSWHEKSVPIFETKKKIAWSDFIYFWNIKVLFNKEISNIFVVNKMSSLRRLKYQF